MTYTGGPAGNMPHRHPVKWYDLGTRRGRLKSFAKYRELLDDWIGRRRVAPGLFRSAVERYRSAGFIHGVTL